MKTKVMKLAASIAAAVLCFQAVPASAAAPMQICMTAESDGVRNDLIENEDMIIKGAVEIKNYTGISSIRLKLRSDSPLVIENGGFYMDPDDDKISALFGNYDTAIYTQYSEVTGARNTALFYTTDTERGHVAEINKEGSPFITFDVRVPKGTPAGDYTLYISREEKTNSVGQIEKDFFCRTAGANLVLDTDVELVPYTIPVFLRGDTDCSNEIEAMDAQRALDYFLETTVLGQTLTDEEVAELTGTEHVKASMRGMDADLDGEISASDAQLILSYYLEQVVGNQPTWDSLKS